MQDNYIYVMFSQTGTWFSTFLRYWTQTQYNHSSISFDPTLTDLYSFGRMSIKEKPWQGRFIVEGKNRGVFAEKPKTTCHVFKLAVSEQQLKKAKEIVAQFEREAPKYKYNIAGLPHVWLGIAWERKYHYFCSSFVAYVLQNAGILDFGKSYSVLKPKDLRRMLRSESLYEGLLTEYKGDVLVK